jgi:hypothetical protein
MQEILTETKSNSLCANTTRDTLNNQIKKLQEAALKLAPQPDASTPNADVAVNSMVTPKNATTPDVVSDVSETVATVTNLGGWPRGPGHRLYPRKC